jgi:quercetin dioxygenase-like cupin family protein
MADSYTVHDPADAALTPLESLGTPQVDLTAALVCDAMRVRVWQLSPGDSLVYHRHREQEELYVCLDGPRRLHVLGLERGDACRRLLDRPGRPCQTTEILARAAL